MSIREDVRAAYLRGCQQTEQALAERHEARVNDAFCDGIRYGEAKCGAKHGRVAYAALIGALAGASIALAYADHLIASAS